MLLFSVCLIFSTDPQVELPVIPGAVGFGSNTVAGRGGRIIRVTNLNSSGPGSLKSALDALGPRIVVFEISGTIILKSDLFVKSPFLTIAGQTAPSPGITIRGGALTILSHDILVSHIRMRVGDDPDGPPKNDRDAFQIYNKYKDTYNVVIDHCSISWSIDENASVGQPGISNVSFLNCICSEGLYIAGHPDYPPGTPHSKGLMIGPDVTNVTVYGCLFAHNDQRNIQVGYVTSHNIEEINNVIYNWGSTAADTYGDLDVIGNCFIPGLNTTNHSLRTRNQNARLYANDNIGGTWWPQCTGSPSRLTESIIPETRIMPSSRVFDYVIRHAGARPADRDAVDKRIIDDVVNRTGTFKNSVLEAGGWPDLEVNRRSVNSNIPGAGPIPDDPNGDSDGDGYTDIEEWLQALTLNLEIK